MEQQTYGEWMRSNPPIPNLTAVEWFYQRILAKDIKGVFEQAKQMEKEQIMKTAKQCHFEGVRQSAKTSEEYIVYAEQYYNETYKK